MDDNLNGDNEEPKNEATHNVGFECPLVNLSEVMLHLFLLEPQSYDPHLLQSHLTIALHFYRVVYYIFL